MNALASADEHRQADPSTPPNRLPAKSPLLDVAPDPVEDVVLVVELLDLPVALELVEPARGRSR